MPTTASTGTRQVSTAKAKDDKAAEAVEVSDKTVDDVVAAHDHPAPGAVDPSGDGVQPAPPHPPAGNSDINGHGLVQVATSDGRHVNVDGSAPDWKAKVRALDPKHPAVRDA